MVSPIFKTSLATSKGFGHKHSLKGAERKVYSSLNLAWGKKKLKIVKLLCVLRCPTFEDIGLLLNRLPNHLPEAVGNSQTEVLCGHLVGLEHAIPTQINT